MSDKPLEFLLYGIQSIQFAVFPELGTTQDVENIRMDLAFDVTPNERCIDVLPLLRLEKKGGEILVIIEVRVSFKISRDDWPRLLDDDNIIRIPKPLAQHLGVIAVGTGRGVLYEKVQAFPRLKELIWPLIDLTSIVKSDVIIDFSEEE
jgi:hypothetical protein